MVSEEEELSTELSTTDLCGTLLNKDADFAKKAGAVVVPAFWKCLL